MSGPVDVLRILEESHEDCVWLRKNSTKTMEVSPEQLQEARAAVAELIEASRSLTESVRAFADGDMSTELRNRLFLKRYEEPAAETLGAVCLANDKAEAAIARVQGVSA